MEIIHLDRTTIHQLEKSCIAIGFFDGLHLGHMQLIKKVENIAQKSDLKKAFMTFSRHPSEIYGCQDFRYLMTMDYKVALLETFNFDYFFIIDFNQEVSHLSPEQFVQHYIVNQNIRYVVCGFDFHFGYRGLADTKKMIALGQNHFQVEVVEKYQVDDKKVSSSIIRQYLNQGKIEYANRLLGRSYRITGIVIHGRRNGTKIGFPTANIDPGRYVLLKQGVYGVYISVSGIRYRGMANIGYNPTFGALDHMSLEVHIFDFHEDIYDQIVSVEFICYVRGEIPFQSVEQLIQQLNQDQEYIQQILV